MERNIKNEKEKKKNIDKVLKDVKKNNIEAGLDELEKGKEK